LIYFLWDIYKDPSSTIFCLGGIMHLKPTAGCQRSILIFENKLWREGLYKYPIKNISRTAKFIKDPGNPFNLAKGGQELCRP
jgi:hypothetical protein